ncbi:hypothetical protein EMCRGX_G026619 [Ephydatia muelleri]
MGAILGRCVPAPTRDPTSRADPEHWGVITTTKYFQADQWRWVPFLVGVYLRQPGTQRHARIRNTGGVTTTNKYFQADQWRWVPFLVVEMGAILGRCVPVPTRDPTSRADPKHWGFDHN